MARRLRLGRRQTPPDKPTHTPGTLQGNATGNYASQAGFLPDGRGTAARATGVNADKREPIDPRMPNLMPG
jgi:hypothetical protein